MNPYAPSTIIQLPRVKTKLAFFAIAAYLAYASMVVCNLGGLSNAFSMYSKAPIGLVVETCLILLASGSAGLVSAYWLGSGISENAVALSRAIGGFAFGVASVTSQPYVLLPFFAGLLTPLERTPFGAIAQFYATIFTQPYILIPTFIVSVILAWTVERLWRSYIPKNKCDEPNDAAELAAAVSHMESQPQQPADLGRLITFFCRCFRNARLGGFSITT